MGIKTEQDQLKRHIQYDNIDNLGIIYVLLEYFGTLRQKV